MCSSYLGSQLNGISESDRLNPHVSLLQGTWIYPRKDVRQTFGGIGTITSITEYRGFYLVSGLKRPDFTFTFILIPIIFVEIK